MELTQQQIKDLKKMSLVLNALNMEDSVCYNYKCYDSEWDTLDGPTYRGRNVSGELSLPDSILDLFSEIRDNFDTSNFYDGYYDNENGSLTFCIVADRNGIDVTYDYYEMNTENTSLEKTFKELASISLPWHMRNDKPVTKILENSDFINEMIDKYGDFLQVRYDGGGDSGWLEAEITSSKDEESLDGRIEDLVYFLLELFHGGWEVNEGSNGSVSFHFKERLVVIQHNMNYQEEREEDYMLIEF
jgi:hypothetical protein